MSYLPPQRARAAKEERRRLEREAKAREKEERARARRQEAARRELELVRGALCSRPAPPYTLLCPAPPRRELHGRREAPQAS